jgi:uncharacterized coiled-coil protein SlyX
MSASKITALENRVAELEKRLTDMEKHLADLAVTGVLNKVETIINDNEKLNNKAKAKRGPTAWSLFVKHVTSEMKAANPDGKVKLPEISAEAKKRKDSGGYDEAHWKDVLSKLSSA